MSPAPPSRASASYFSFFFFFNDTATTEIYTLSLHDALPILSGHRPACASRAHVRVRPLAGSVGRNADMRTDRKSTRLNSSHVRISYAVFCLKKKKQKYIAQEALEQVTDALIRLLEPKLGYIL